MIKNDFILRNKDSIIISFIMLLVGALFTNIRTILSFFAHIFSSYSESFNNSIYITAASGVVNYDVILFIIIFTLLLFLYYIVLLKKMTANKKSPKEKTENKSSKLTIIIIMTIIITFVTLYEVSKMYSIESTRKKFIHQIQILSPYMTDLKIKKLYSNFALMKNEADFDSIITDLKKISDENGILLPKTRI